MEQFLFWKTVYWAAPALLGLWIIPPLLWVVKQVLSQNLNSRVSKSGIFEGIRYSINKLPLKNLYSRLIVFCMKEFYINKAPSGSGRWKDVWGTSPPGNALARGAISCLILLFLAALSINEAMAQTRIVFQGGEGGISNCWTVTPATQGVGSNCVPVGFPSALNPRTGSGSMIAGGGCSDGCTSNPTHCFYGTGFAQGGCNQLNGTVIEFATVNVAAYNGAQLTVYHRSRQAGCAASGFEADDVLRFEVNENNGGYVVNAQMNGSGAGYLWDYTTTPAGGSQQVPNPYTYSIPGPCVQTFQFRTNFVRGANPRADEVYFLDDVELTFVSGKPVTFDRNTICAGQTVTFTADACVIGDGNWDFQWQKNGIDIPGATASTLTTAAISNGDIFTVKYIPRTGIQNGGCVLPDAISPGVTITVNPIAVAGTATMNGSATVCTGSTKTLTLTGSTGVITWEEDPGCINVFSPIGNGSPFNTAPLTQTVCFRATVVNGPCSAVSNTLTVTVNPLSVAGTPSIGPATICEGEQTTLSLAGYTGSIQWQEQVNCTGAFTAIVGAITDNYLAGPYTAGTMCFRARVQNAPCATVSSATLNLTISASPVSGTVSSAQTLCEGSTATVSVAGQVGNIQWQEDPGCTGTFSDIPGATLSSYTSGALSFSTAYRVMISNSDGSCTPVFSNAVCITIDPTPFEGFSFASFTDICEGATSDLSVFGYVGTIQWQEDPGCTGTFNDIVGATNDTYNTGPLFANACYRAVVSSGVCPQVISNELTITVSPASQAGTVSVDLSHICEGDIIQLSIAGQTGTHRWQEDVNCTNFFTDIGIGNENPLVYGPVNTRSCYRAVVTSGTCPPVNSQILEVTVDPFPNSGFAVDFNVFDITNTICEGTNTQLFLMGSLGTIQWQEDPGCTGTFTDIPGANTNIEPTPPLSGLTCFRAAVSSGICQTLFSNVVTIFVDPLTVPGTASVDNTPVCQGDPYTLTLTGHTGTMFWEEDPGCFGFYTPIGGIDQNPITINFAIQTSCYRATVFSGVCNSDVSNIVMVEVNDLPIPGTVSPDETICQNDNRDMTITGSIGNLQWEEDPGCGGIFSAILGATNTIQNTGNLLQTTCYRVAVTNGVCPVAYSTTIRITTDLAPIGGTVTGPAQVCEDQSWQLDLAGYQGQIQWQEDPGCTNAFTDVIGQNAPSFLFPAPQIPGTNCYRAVLTNGICAPVTSNTVQVIIDPISVAGTASFDQTLCNGNSANLDLIGYTGLIQWQEDPGCTNTFTDIPGATIAPYLTAGLLQTTCFRANVTNGACATVSSNLVTVTVDPVSVAGTVAINLTEICDGQTIDLSISGQVGNHNWEEDFGCTNNFIPVGNQNDNPLTLNPSVGMTCYRAVVQSGTCPSTITNTVNVVVHDIPLAGTINSSQTVCIGTDVTLTLAGSVGLIQWQQQVLCSGPFTDIAGASSATYSTGPLTQTTCFRTYTYNTGCTSAFSTPVTIQVDPASVAGTPTVLPTDICIGDPINLSVAGNVGSVQWQEDINCTNFYVNIGLPNQNPLNYTPAFFGTHCYRGVVTSGTCPPQITGISSVNVRPTPLAGTASSDQTICNGSSASLTLAGSTGNIQWQEDPLCTNAFVDIIGAVNSNLTTAGLTQNTCFRASVSQPGCPAVFSNTVTVTVDPTTVAGTVAINLTEICTGQTVDLTISGQVGNHNWEEDFGCTNTFVPVGNQNDNPLTLSPAVGMTCYRAVVQSGTCPAVITNIVNVVVHDTPIAGTINSSQTVCTGTDVTLTLAGSVGLIQWQQQVLCSGGFADIVGAISASYSTGPLTQTTCFRTYTYNTGCTSAFSTPVTVQVDPASVAGTPTVLPTDICIGDPINLSVAGNVGSVQWQEDVNCTNSYVNIGLPNQNPLNYTPAFFGTHCYRGVVTSGACPPQITGISSVNVRPTPIAGTASADQTICTGSSASLTLAGSTGNIQWQEDPLCTNAFVDIVGANNANLTTAALTQNTCFRASVSQPGCPAVFSNTITATVSPVSVAGVPNLSNSLPCEGQTVDLTIAGNVGDIQWQEDPGCFGVFTNVGPINANPYTVTPPIGQICYRAVLTSGACPSVITGSMTVTTSPQTVAGTASPDATICSGQSNNLLLVGSVGSVQWQEDLGCTNTFTNIAGATNVAYNTGPLTATTCYRACVQSGTCAQICTNVIMTTVDPVSVPGTASVTPNPVCEGSAITLSVAGNVGTVQWEESFGCTPTYTAVGNFNSNPLVLTPVAGQTCYRAIIQSGTCPVEITNVLTVDVGPTPAAGVADIDQTLCTGSGAVLNLTGSAGNIQWQEDPLCANVFTDMVGFVTGNITTTPLTQTTCYRARVFSQGCPDVFSNIVTVTIDPVSVTGIPNYSNSIVCLGSTIDLTLTGNIGTIQWQEDLGCLNNYLNVGPINANPYTFAPPLGLACYRAVVTSGVCAPSTTGAMQINTYPQTVAGTASADATICNGQSSNLTLAGQTGNIQWQSSIDNVTFNDIPGATNLNLNTGALTQTTFFRANVQSPGCSIMPSNTVTITVDPATVAGTPNFSSSILCEGQTVDLTIAGNVGDVQWQEDPGCQGVFADVGAVNANPLTLAPANGTTCYRACVTSGSCPTVCTGVMIINVNPLPIPGVADFDQTVCSGSGASLFLTGSVGTIQWQEDPLCTNAFVNIAGAINPLLNSAPLTQNTCFRAVVSSPGCTDVNSNTVTVIVSPATVAGVPNFSNSLPCEGQTVDLTITGNVGDIQWQEDFGCFGVFADVGPVNSNPYTVTPAIGQTCYRAVVTSGACPSAITGTMTITTSPQTVAGTASPDATICSGQSNNLLLTGSVGSVQWQQDPGCTNTFTDIVGATNVAYNTGPLTLTTCYRASVQSGSCQQIFSNVVTTTVDPVSVAGTASANPNPVCDGSAVTLSVAGNVGTVQWEESFGCTPTYTAVGNFNSNPLVLTPIVGQTCYRAVIQSGTCPVEITNVVTVDVGQIPAAGIASADQTICQGSSADLILVNSVGTIQWQSAATCAGPFTDIIGAINANYNTGTLNATTCFRAQVSSLGCATVFSNNVTITVSPPSVVGTPNYSSNNLCEGQTVDLTLSGNTGDFQWQEQANCTGGFVNVGTPNTTPLTLTPVVGITCYRVVVTSGTCPSQTSGVLPITVNTLPVAGVITGNNSVCVGGSTILTLTGSAGNIQWESQANCTGGFTNVAGGITATLNTGPLTQTTCFRVTLTSPTCPNAVTAVYRVDEFPASVAGTATIDFTDICEGSNIELSIAGNTGDYQWQEQPNCTGAFNNIGVLNSNQLVVGPVNVTTCYRAVVTSGVCPPETTNVVTTTVSPLPIAGTATADQTICSGTNANLTLTGSSGSIQWQSQANCTGAFVDEVNATLANFSSAPLTQRTCFRAAVSTLSCPAVFSNIVQVDIDAPTNPGTATITPGNTVCNGTNVTITLTGFTGTIQWQKATICAGPFTDIGAPNTNPLMENAVTASACYRAQVTSGSCPSQFSNLVDLQVDQPTAPGTVTPDQTICSGTGTQVVLTGSAGNIQWEAQANCSGGFTAIVGETNATLNTGVLAQTTCYRAVLTSGSCPQSISPISRVTVDPLTVAGTATSNFTSICAGDNLILTLAGHTGTIQWQQQANCAGGFTDVGAPNVNPLTVVGFVTRTCFRAQVQSGVCPQLTSNVVDIDVAPLTVAGTATPSARQICQGSSTTFDLIGFVGDIQWQQQPNCTGAFTDTTGTSATFTTTNLVDVRCYRAVVRSGSCPQMISNVVRVDIDQPTNAGTLASGQNVCRGNHSTVLTLSGFLSSIIRWEASTDNFVLDIQNLGNPLMPTLTVNNLTVDTWYRVVVDNGDCPEVLSNVIKLTVDTPPVAGTASVAPIEICATADPVLTLTGSSGSIQWQSQVDCIGGFVDMAGRTNATENLIGVNTTTCYRAIVSNGVCPAETSNVVTFTVYQNNTGGTVSVAPALICGDVNTVTATLNGYSGTILRWEYSPDCFASVINQDPSQLPTITLTNLPYPNSPPNQICIRAIVKNGLCPQVFSANGLVDVLPPTIAGTLNADASVCTGVNSTNLTLTGNQGAPVRWETSPDNFATPGLITTILTNATSRTFTNLTQNLFIRVWNQNGAGCVEAVSNVVKITVDQPSVAGTIAADQTPICPNQFTTLRLVNNGGTIQWQESAGSCAGPFTDIAGETQPNYTTPALNAPVCYRAVITNGSCPSVNTNQVLVDVTNLSVGGTLSADATVCSNQPNSTNLLVVNFTGTIVRWEQSNDPGFVPAIAIPGTAGLTNYTATDVNATTYYRVVVKNGPCPEVFSTSITITADPASSGGTLTADAARVCAGVNTVNFNLTGQVGNIVRWELSYNGFGNITTINQITPTIQVVNQSLTYQVRAVVKSGVCPEVLSNAVQVIVDPSSQGGLLSTAQTICVGGQFNTLTLTGQVGTILRWESSTDGFVGNINPIANVTNSQLGYTLLQNTCFRVVAQNGSCPPAYSNQACITTDAQPVAGTLGSNATVCAGGNNGTITLNGSQGTIIRWESTTTTFPNNIVPLPGGQNTLTYANLNTTTKYRAVVDNGACNEVFSNEVTIQVDQPSQAGIISGGTTVCAPINTITLTASGQTGTILRWESSIDNFATIVDRGNGGNSTYLITNETQTTRYRVVVKSGVCPEVTSNAADVVVVQPATDPLPVATPNSACINIPVNLTSNDPLPGVGNWACVGANCNNALIANANAQNTTVIFTAPGNYVIRRTHSGPAPVCGAKNADLTILITDAPTVANAGQDQTLCATDATIIANPAIVGTGLWTRVSGTATITDPFNPNTTVTGLAPGANVFRWTISNPPCPIPSTDDVTVTRVPEPTPANAGPDIVVCNSTTGQIIAGPVANGVGVWSYIAGPSAAQVITNGSIGNITGLTIEGRHEFEFCVSNPPCNISCDRVFVDVKVNPLRPVTINGPTSVCQNGVGQFSVPPIAGETYTFTTTPPGPIVNPTSATSADITFPTAGAFVIIATPQNACGSGPSQVKVVNVLPVLAAYAGLDRMVCGGSTTVIGSPNGGTWSCVTCPPPGTIIPAGNTGIVTNMVPGQDYVFRYTLPNNNCTTTTDDVTIKNDQANPGTISANNGTICEGQQVILTLAGNSGPVVRWEYSTDGGGSFTSIGTITSTLTVNPTVTTNYRAVITQTGFCPPSFTPLQTVIVQPNPTVTATPATLSTCNSIQTVTGSPLPEGATGIWTQVSGPNSVINTSGVQGYISGMNIPGTYVYRWTVTNPPCQPQSADVTITKIDATVADAGVPQTLCGNTDVATLTGNAIASGCTATWTFIGGPVIASVTPQTPNTATAGGMTQPGTYIFEYAINCPPCPITRATVSITKYNVPAANAGNDLTTCNPIAQLVGNDPTPGTGTWTLVSAPPGPSVQVTNFNGYFANVTGMSDPGDYTFRWTITFPGCPTSFDDVVVKVLDNSNVAQVVDASVSVCGTSTTTISAIAPNSGTGTWSFIGGPDPNAGIQTVGVQGNISGMTLPGQYRFRWTVVNACGTTTADVVVTREDNGVAFAGQDQTVCDKSFALVMGNPPPPGCTGQWTFISGPDPAQITTAGVFGSIVNMNKKGDYLFEWKFVCGTGSCPPSSSVIKVTRVALPTPANAGAPQVICGTTATLSGNTPVEGIGAWRFVSGPVIPNVSDVNNVATVSGMTKDGVYNFCYKISNAPCASSESCVTVTVNTPSNGGIMAGGGGTFCANANSGTMTLSNSNGTIIRWESANDANFTQNVTPIPNTTSIQNFFNLTTSTCFRVIVKNGSCPEAQSNVQCVTITQAPTVANAGPDVELCSTDVNIIGNTPVNGVGTWTQVSGPACVLNQAGTTAVISQMTTPGQYIFRYSIANSPCEPSQDEVIVKVNPTGVSGSVISDRTLCSITNSGTLRLTGYSGTILRWEAADDVAFTQNLRSIPNVTDTYLYTNVTATTYYRAVVKTGNCPPAFSNPAKLTINEVVTANGGLDQDVCGSATILTGNNPGSGVGTWSLSSGPPANVSQSGVQANISGMNTAGTYIFQYKITNGTCPPSVDYVIVNVSTGSVAGVVNGDRTVCKCQGVTLVVTGVNGQILRWESSNDNWQANINSINNPTAQLTVPQVCETTQYRVVVKDGSCPTATSLHVTVTVNQPPTPANAGGNQVVCGTTATLTGNNPVVGTGSWAYVTGPNGTPPTVVNSVNQAFVSGLIPGTYVFRYTTTNLPCGNSSAEMTLIVMPQPNAGSIVGGATVCSGTNSNSLTLTGYSGNIVRWESSTDPNFVPLTSIANTNATIIVNNLTTTTYYRPVVEIPGCNQVTSQPVAITVSQPSAAGIVVGAATVCIGNNSGNITLSGNVGNVVTWEQSTDNVIFTAMNNPINTLTYQNLTQTTYYRAIIQNAPCAQVTSASVAITVTNATVAGAVTTDQTFCAVTNSGTLTLAGHQGNVLRWESSLTGQPGSWTTIGNINTSYNFLNVTTTTFFRAVVQNGSCPEAGSTPATVTIDLTQSGGTIALANQTVCAGSNSGTLTLTGHTGSITRWESAPDALFGSPTVIPNTTNVQTFSNLASDTYYRAIVQSGPCTLISATAKVTTIAAPTAGTTTADATVCAPTNSGTLTLSGQIGTVVRWESSEDPNFVGLVTTIPVTSTSIGYSNLTVSTSYRPVIVNGPCAPINGNAVRITVTPASVAGTITGNIGACAGSAIGTLTLSGNVGNVVRWESSTNSNFSPLTIISVTTNTLAYNVSVTTYYRAIVQSGNCATATSAGVEVLITPPPTPGTLTSNATVCNGVNSGTLTLFGYSGNVVRWESSTDNFVNNITTINNTTAMLTFSNLAQTSQFRVVIGRGVCPEVNSNFVTVKVLPALTLNAIPVVGCSNIGSISATATGGNGAPYTYSIIPAVAPNNNSGVFTNISQGTYTVKVTDNFGCSTTTIVTIGNTPTPPVITSVQNITTNSALVSWGNMGVGVIYTFRYRILNSPTWTLISNLTNTSLYLSGLQNNTTYEIQVSYKCPNNGPQSGFSTGVITQFTTLSMGACNLSGSFQPIPGGTYVDNLSGTSAMIHWNLVPGARGYIISFGLQSQNPNTWTQVVVCDPTNQYLMNNLLPNTAYGVRVRTNCSNCTTALNNNDKRSNWTVIIKYTTTARGEEITANAENGVKVYPNPNKGQFNIMFNSDKIENILVRMIDVTGRIVLERSHTTVEGENELPIELNGYSSGVYLLQFERNGIISTTKVVIE